MTSNERVKALQEIEKDLNEHEKRLCNVLMEGGIEYARFHEICVYLENMKDIYRQLNCVREFVESIDKI